MFFFCLIGIVIEFAIRVLTILFPASLKGAFYHSMIVLVLSVVIGRQVTWSDVHIYSTNSE